MRQPCDEAGATLVTGDTKVVDRGKGDQVFITTSGVGLVPQGCALSIHAARPGDRILVSETLGDHGMAIMSVREGLEFDTVLASDSASLADLAQQMLEAVLYEGYNLYPYRPALHRRHPVAGWLLPAAFDFSPVTRVRPRRPYQIERTSALCVQLPRPTDERNGASINAPCLAPACHSSNRGPVI